MSKYLRGPFALALCVGLGLAAGAAPTSAAQPGLDPRFGDGGSVVHRIYDDYADAAVYADPVGLTPRGGGGYLLFTQTGADLGVFAYRGDGTIDRSFHRGGFNPVEQDPRGDDDLDDPAVALRDRLGRVVVPGGINLDRPGASGESQSLTRFKPSGEPDRSFGRNGLVLRQGLPGTDAATITPGGIITTAANAARTGGRRGRPLIPGSMQISRYLPDGSPDRRFGSQGTYTRSIGQRSIAVDVAADDRGRVLVNGIDDLGTLRKPDRRFRLFRLTRTGKIDRSFGEDGFTEGLDGFLPTAIATDGDRAIVGGYGKQEGESVIFVVGPGGEIDRSLGDGGVVKVGESFGYISQIEAMPGGEFLLKGRDSLAVLGADGSVRHAEGELFRSGRSRVAMASDDGFVYLASRSSRRPQLARVTAGLQPDPAFAPESPDEPAFRVDQGGSIQTLTALNDGSLLAANYDYGSDGYASMRRYTGKGSPIANFGRDGVSATWSDRFPPIYDWSLLPGAAKGSARLLAPGGYDGGALRLEIDRTGKIRPFHLAGIPSQNFLSASALPGGGFMAVGNAYIEAPTRSGVRAGFRVVRYGRNGLPDPSFGRNGIADVFFPFSAQPFAVARDHRGRIVVAGGDCVDTYGCVGGPAGKEATFIRLTPRGRLDRSFGKRGRVQLSFGKGGAVQKMSIRRDGTIVGLVRNRCLQGCPNTDRFVAIRPDGRLDRRFGRGGRLTLRLGLRLGVVEVFPGGPAGVDAAAVLQTCRDESRYAVLRIDDRGRLDRRFGGGDGVLDSGVARGRGVWADGAVKQSRGTVTVGGVAYYAGRNGLTETGFGMVRFKLSGRDGRTELKPCRR